MSTKRDDSELPMSEPNADDDAVFDDLARRAGAALRRPAPDDGVRVIAARRRRQQALKATVVGGAAVATLIGVLVVASTRDPDGLRPADSTPATLPATTTPAPMTTGAPTQTALPVDPSPATIAQPPPGEEITVTADLVEFGDRLVGLIGNMDRADGRTYVIAGRYETEDDLLRAPDEAVLAAFDDAGQELWRTELAGSPIAVVAVAGDVWVRHDAGMSEWLSRIDASNGQVVDQVTFGNLTEMVGAFGSIWVQTGESPFSGQLIRVDPDLSTTTVELPDRVFSENADPWPDAAAVGPDAIWVPLGEAGVAVIDADTVEVTVIPADEIGHDVQKVGFDGDVVYVASLNQVTSIVDGQVRATTSPGQIQYLGPIDGVFGVQLPDRQFEVLRANDPMVVEHRQVAIVAIAREIDGEAWVETGRNYNLRRVELLPL